MTRRIYRIDGNNFSTLEEFWDEISRVLVPGVFWGRNLDAFNDTLRGGFGTPAEGFVLVWKNSALSQQKLGYAETTKQFEKRLERCHPAIKELVERQLEESKRHEFPTVFEWLIEIIGDEEHDDIELRLE